MRTAARAIEASRRGGAAAPPSQSAADVPRLPPEHGDHGEAAGGVHVAEEGGVVAGQRQEAGDDGDRQRRADQNVGPWIAHVAFPAPTLPQYAPGGAACSSRCLVPLYGACYRSDVFPEGLLCALLSSRLSSRRPAGPMPTSTATKPTCWSTPRSSASTRSGWRSTISTATASRRTRLLLATHVAARTKRIRIGTAANVLPLSHPVRVAEQTAMLDILSEGRLDVGFAKGYGPREFMGYGVDQRESEERFREALEIIFAAWTQDEFSYEGRHFTIPKASIRPRPRTKPHPSAYVATTGSQPTIDLAAKLGLPFYVAYRGRKHFAEIKERYRAAAAGPRTRCRGGGRNPRARRGDADLLPSPHQRRVLRRGQARRRQVQRFDQFGELPQRPRHLAARHPGTGKGRTTGIPAGGAIRTTTATGTPSSTATRSAASSASGICRRQASRTSSSASASAGCPTTACDGRWSYSRRR